MYESFYNLREKPFTLLPDPGFLFLSDKHSMALTLLEYGLMNQAGFTVISGDIGTGKTTMIRHLLDNMDREHTVGLISNTHRDFGDLLQWILLAFDLDHNGMNKVEMYQRFIDFIIDEYAHNRRTVLIVDEAQNMGVETLEELRMLSNINADKDQALQVILVGQRELRETLRRPDLVQFAQRISVDYHLEPLSEQEVIGYIRHRVTTAGGKPELFSEEACRAAHRFSGGVPRLVNQLCDNALVYGYAEQLKQIDSRLVNDVAYEKQKGGIFPVYAEADPPTPREAAPEPQAAPEPATDQTVAAVPETQSEQLPGVIEKSNAVQAAASADTGEIDEYARFRPENTAAARPQIVPPAAPVGNKKKNHRVAVASARATLCHYLSRLLESYGFDIVSAGPCNGQFIGSLKHNSHDALLIDCYEDAAGDMDHLATTLENWPVPVLFNDSMITEISLQQGSPEFGKELAERLTAILTQHPVAHAGP
jgi:type II secretory pathway predicted ATPase ExeA